MFAQAAKGFNASIYLHKQTQSANAKSLVAIMALQTVQGDTLQVSAAGDDADAAIKALVALLAEGCGEAIAAGKLGVFVQDLAILQSLPLAGKLHYIPSKSTAEPLSFGDTQVPDIQEPDSLALEHQKLAKARQEKMRHVKDAAARAERAWEGAASATREALVSLARSPRASGQQLSQLSRDTAADPAVIVRATPALARSA